MTLTVGSLFSGIGGIDLGLERAGMITKWQVEIDPYARRILERHFPHAARFTDVRTVGAAELDRVDLIAGGFPCQDISNAGKRVGIDGERSGLWSEYIRIVRELRPRFVLVENVAALLGRGLSRVLGDLAASGFDAEWDCIPAAAVGAPHRRDRLFLVAYAQREQRGLQPESQSRRGDSSVVGDDGLESTHQPEAPAHADGARELQPQGRIFDERRRPGDCGWWTSEPDVGRVAHGVPARVDRLRALGNAVVPQVAEFIGRRILEASR
jgi:DNA (cytosine-5)-methyltransferase 1